MIMRRSRINLKKLARFGITLKFKNKDLEKVWDRAEKRRDGELERMMTEYMNCIRNLILFGECVTKDKVIANMLTKQF